MDTKTIIYFKHGLGNLIMMTPAIQALASMDASGKTDICMSSDWQDARRPAYDDFFDKWDIIQDIINYPKQEFKKDYKRYFYTGHSEHSEAINIFAKKCPVKAEAPDWTSKRHHEIFYYMNLVEKMGYKGSVPGQYVPLANKPILQNGKALKIGLCNGTYSVKMQAPKQWQYFDKLVLLLKDVYNCKVIKIGYKDELKEVNADIDYVGKLSFTETTKVISQLDLLITTDTALMHAGDALQIPMVVIFGASLISKNGAISNNAENIALGLPCQPCQRTHNFYNCPHYNCINKLPVGTVMDAVRRRLRDTS